MKNRETMLACVYLLCAVIAGIEIINTVFYPNDWLDACVALVACVICYACCCVKKKEA